MTKAERTELRQIVKGQFAVLRAEIDQRKAELITEVDGQIDEKFAVDDKAWADAAHLAHEAVMEANRKVNDAYRDLTGERHVERMYVGAQLPSRPREERFRLQQTSRHQIDATVRGALLRLQRQEADLLRTLAVGAIESDEARAFLEAIPSVGELVPAARLTEIEASLRAEDES